MRDDILNEENEFDIAIIGMSGRFPGARDIDTFWHNLAAGKESIATLSDEDMIQAGVDPARIKDPNYVKAAPVLDEPDMFDPVFFGYSPREAAMMDPQHRLFLECAWEALEQAGYDPSRYDSPIGVYGGAAMNTYFMFSGLTSSFISEYLPTLIGNDNSFLTTRVSYKLNLKGPSITVQTACSTGLVAVHTACQSLLNEECTMALAGGVSVRVPHQAGHLYQEGSVFTPDGHCRTFDANAGGTIFGSGAGMVLLKRLGDAVSDGDHIYAVVKGSAINNDGASKTDYTAPSVNSQSEVIVEALANAGVDADTISYIEAHGTGTYLGDPIEIRALTKAFQTYTDRTGFCAIGSVKTNIGHLDAAAGIAGLIKTVLSLQHKKIPASLHFETPNPEIDFDSSPFYVNHQLSDWVSDHGPRRAGVTALGIGGTNAHVILEEAPRIRATGSSEKRPHLLVFSAKSEAALDHMTANLAEHLKAQPDTNLADVAYTLQVGRKTFDYRRTVMVKDQQDAVSALEEMNPGRINTSVQDRASQEVVFMFPGQGAQYVNMGLELYQTETVFKAQVDQCAEMLKRHMNMDIRDILYPEAPFVEGATEKLRNTLITQPALFVIEYALARLWMSWGLKPAALIGHSVGEYVAACLAGVFSVEEALGLVAARGRLMGDLPGGAMLAVPLSEQDVQPYLSEQVAIAGINGPSSCVLSGNTEAIQALEAQLLQKDITCQHLHTSHAFHSHMMEPVLEPFIEQAGQVHYNAPQLPIVSTVTGTWVTPEDMADPHYWTRNLRQTVRFADGVGQLLEAPDRVLLEVGPGQTLQALVRQQISKGKGQVALSSLRHPKKEISDVAFILETLGQIWAAGVEINWADFYANETRSRLPLPTYPFERQRYWLPDGEQAAMVSSQTTGHLPSYRNEISNWFYAPLWKPSVTPVVKNKVTTSSSWVVFVDETCTLGMTLIKRLKELDQQVFIIHPGHAFTHVDYHTFIINPQHAGDYDTLFNILRDQGNNPQTIIHMWHVTSDDQDLSVEGVDQVQHAGLYSLIYLAQTMGKHESSEPCRIEFISSGMHEVIGNEPLSPPKTTAMGACKVIPLEYDRISCRSIDIVTPQAGSRQEDRLVDQLMAEIQTDGADQFVAYRGRHRWVQTVEPVEMDETCEADRRLREEGVYLITGGLGGIGLSLAEYLAETKQARLILVGRSSFPARDAWTHWLAENDPNDATSEKIRKIQAMEAMGAEVLVLSADISDQTQMQSIITRAMSHFGMIHGVIHAAGIIDDAGIIERRTRDTTEQALVSKVRGTMVLDAVLKDIPLDFLVLCSSMATVLYHNRFGEVGYVAANSFLDAYSCHKTREDGPYTVTINWDEWQEVGMAVKAADQFGMSSSYDPLDSFTPSEGVSLFRRILNSDLPNVLISTRDLNLRIGLDARATSPFMDAATSFGSARPALSSDYEAPRNEIEQAIAGIWQELLGIDQIGINDDYFKLGGDSLRATQVIARLRDALQVEISLQHMFEAPTIADMAEKVEVLRLAGRETTDVPMEQEASIEGEI